MTKYLLKEEMGRWVKRYCENDEKAEEQFQAILSHNTRLVNNVKNLFKQNNAEAIKRILEDHIRLKLDKIACNNCKSVNIFLKSHQNKKCNTCNEHFNDRPADNGKRKCIYCNNPVSPNSKMTCLQHRNVRFKYY